MLDGVFPAPGIERVAVGQERIRAQRAHHVHHGAGVVGAQEADIAHFSEVHLNGGEPSLHINFADARPADELLQLGGQAVPVGLRAKIAEIHRGFGHGFLSFFACILLIIRRRARAVKPPPEVPPVSARCPHTARRLPVPYNAGLFGLRLTNFISDAVVFAHNS